jgi:hypothetical protein
VAWEPSTAHRVAYMNARIEGPDRFQVRATDCAAAGHPLLSHVYEMPCSNCGYQVGLIFSLLTSISETSISELHNSGKIHFSKAALDLQ